MSEDFTTQQETLTVYIGNLNYSTRWYELKDHIEELGFPDVFVDIPFVNNRSKGFAVVRFKTIEDAKAAIQKLNGTTFQERVITADFDRMRRVMFRGLPFRVRWYDLKDLCAEYGKVIKADIHTGQDGRPNGLGSVYFATLDDAMSCIQALDGSELQGRKIFCHLYVYHNTPKPTDDDSDASDQTASTTPTPADDEVYTTNDSETFA